MNVKISIAVLIAFSFTFLSLIVFSNVAFSDSFEASKNNQFFQQKFDPMEKKVFLFGSSHVAFVNTTHIINKVSQENPRYVIYNLAYGNDTPERRYDTLQETISLNPKIVFYGVSYLTFHTKPAETNQIPNISQLLEGKVDVIPKNPKRITLNVIRDILNDKKIFSATVKDITLPNAPFVAFQKDRTIILDNNELKREVQTSNYEISITPIIKNEEINYFKKILSELQEKNITVVIFKTPHHPFYHEIVPDSEKNALDSVLDDVSKEFNIKIYDFSKKYSEMHVWADTTHVAYNKNALIYSDDIAKMIISEIEK